MAITARCYQSSTAAEVVRSIIRYNVAGRNCKVNENRFESVSQTCCNEASSGDVRGILSNKVQWNCMCILSKLFIGNMSHKQIYYSDKYNDEHYEYRHVVLPREMVKQVPKSHLMSEDEWRRMGVQQSLGWVHYMIHEPEPHILLFRRPLPKN